MVVDANVYWIPETLFTDVRLQKRFFEAIPEQYGWHGKIENVPGTEYQQIVLEKPAGYPNLNYLQGDYTLGGILKDMDDAGIDCAMLKVPGCHEWMTPELCHLFNEGMAEFFHLSKGRLIPSAVVAPGSIEAVSELDYCVEKLGMKSIQLCAHYGDKYLDDLEFAPFFERVNAYKMPVYVHHTPVPVDYQSFLTYNKVRRSYGRVVDQGIAICRELYSGMFDRYPDVKMIHSMLGGGFFAIAELMMPSIASPGEHINRFQASGGTAIQRWRENIYFEMSHAQPWGKEPLEAAIKICGADHIIWGSSYPVRKEWQLGGPDFVRSLDISEEDKELLLSGNAIRIYQLQ